MERSGPRTPGLQRCRIVKAQGASPTPRAPAAPAHPPLGEDAVYQWTGAGGCAYQSRPTLLVRTAYRVDAGAPRTSVYSAGSKPLRFTTGPLRGFSGRSSTVGRNADGPTIALHPAGPVQALDSAANGRSQYAFFRPPAAP